MKRSAFETLCEHQTTSWAVWDDGGDCTVAFFRRHLDVLHARAVIVGLNPSAGLPNTWPIQMPNFHTVGNKGDNRLRRHIQDGQLTHIVGALMTDVSDEIETDSRKVKVDPYTATSKLIQKVQSVDRRKERFIICLGNDAFDIIRKGLSIPSQCAIHDNETYVCEFSSRVGDEDWRIFRIWHSAHWGRDIESQFGMQLRTINHQMEIEASAFDDDMAIAERVMREERDVLRRLADS